MKKTLPSPITMLMVVIILSAICTWLIPSGQYNKLSVKGDTFVVESTTGSINLPLTQRTLDSLLVKIPIQKFTNGDIRKPVSIPDTYQKSASNPQGFISVIQAPLKGIMDSIDIILFVLLIGGFMFIFNATGAMFKGISYLSYSMRGREPLLISILIFTFATLRASYGMEEESLIFYPILVPLFISAGYDLLVPLAVIFGGTYVGGIAALSNPFTVIIASNAAGINWMDGIYSRAIFFLIATSFLTWYILKYAAKVKKDPAASLVLKIDGDVKSPYDLTFDEDSIVKTLDLKTKLLLLIYLLTFVSMIVGVVVRSWWTTEMSALFLGSSILLAVVTRMSEKTFITEFINGAQSMLSVAFVIGVARGVTIILNEGKVSDSILYYTSIMAQGMSPVLLILLLLVFYFGFTFFISSSSGMAVLTMPIIGALAIMVNIPGREVVNAYMYGMNLMFFITPTGLILPTLALVNVSLKVWMKFIIPPLIILATLSAVFLIAGLYL